MMYHTENPNVDSSLAAISRKLTDLIQLQNESLQVQREQLEILKLINVNTEV